LNFFIFVNELYLYIYNNNKKIYMGIGDWGLGIGDWGVGAIPNPQYPIPNPQSPIPNPHLLRIIF